MDLNDSLRALSIKPFQGLEIQEQGNEPSISGGSSDEKYQKDRESAIPEPCVA